MPQRAEPCAANPPPAGGTRTAAPVDTHCPRTRSGDQKASNHDGLPRLNQERHHEQTDAEGDRDEGREHDQFLSPPDLGSAARHILRLVSHFSACRTITLCFRRGSDDKHQRSVLRRSSRRGRRCPTASVQIQHPTANTQQPTSNRLTWKLDIGCWLLDIQSPSRRTITLCFRRGSDDKHQRSVLRRSSRRGRRCPAVSVRTPNSQRPTANVQPRCPPPSPTLKLDVGCWLLDVQPLPQNVWIHWPSDGAPSDGTVKSGVRLLSSVYFRNQVIQWASAIRNTRREKASVVVTASL